jgi:hypothetical protein
MLCLSCVRAAYETSLTEQVTQIGEGARLAWSGDLFSIGAKVADVLNYAL